MKPSAGSEIVQFGNNFDGKRGHEPVVIGLSITDAGGPICVEIFPGNGRHFSDGQLVRPSPLLDEQRRQLGKQALASGERRWSLSNILETFKAQRSETATLADTSFTHITDPTASRSPAMAVGRDSNGSWQRPSLKTQRYLTSRKKPLHPRPFAVHSTFPGA